MGDWNSIFKKRGKVFLKPHEDMKDIIRVLKKEKANRVLDLGCGTGRHTVMLAKAGFDVYGMDVSKEGLRLTRRWLKELNLKAKLKHASCYKRFPFKDNFFDAIISIQVIHHAKIDKIRYCISEIERVLKPCGIIFITFAKSRYGNIPKRFKIIELRTYVKVEGEEEGLPHYIYNQSLLRKDFKNFKILDLHLDSKRHHCILGRLK